MISIACLNRLYQQQICCCWTLPVSEAADKIVPTFGYMSPRRNHKVSQRVNRCVVVTAPERTAVAHSNSGGQAWLEQVPSFLKGTLRMSRHVLPVDVSNSVHRSKTPKRELYVFAGKVASVKGAIHHSHCHLNAKCSHHYMVWYPVSFNLDVHTLVICTFTPIHSFFMIFC